MTKASAGFRATHSCVIFYGFAALASFDDVSTCGPPGRVAGVELILKRGERRCFAIRSASIERRRSEYKGGRVESARPYTLACLQAGILTFFFSVAYPACCATCSWQPSGLAWRGPVCRGLSATVARYTPREIKSFFEPSHDNLLKRVYVSHCVALHCFYVWPESVSDVPA